LALGVAGAFFVGTILANLWPPTPDPAVTQEAGTAAATVSLWLVDLIIPLWFVLFYARTLLFFSTRGEVRNGPARPLPMRRGELERDAQLRSLGFVALGQFEAHIVGRSWRRYWAYVNADGSVTATIGHSGYSSIVGFTTRWTNGFYLCAFNGARGVAVAPASAERRVILLRGSLQEAYQQYSAEVSGVEFPTPAGLVLTTSLPQMMAQELDDFKTLPATAALARRSKPGLFLGAMAAIVLVFGVMHAVTLFPWG
jgi:hypothetical protein